MLSWSKNYFFFFFFRKAVVNRWCWLFSIWTVKQTKNYSALVKFCLYGKIRGVYNIHCKTIRQKNGLPRWPGNTASVNKSNHQCVCGGGGIKDLGTILDTKRCRRCQLHDAFEQRFEFLDTRRYDILSQTCWTENEGINPSQGGERKEISQKSSWRWGDITGVSSSVSP